MRPYWAMMTARFRTLLQYRAAAMAGFGTQLFFGYAIARMYEALYASTSAHQPMSREQVITYVWLGQAMLGFVPWTADQSIAQLVRTGGVAYEMLRPVDVYWMWYSRALGQRLAPTLMKSIPMFVVAGLFLDLDAPVSINAAVWWLVSTAGAACLAAAIAALMGISLLWTISGAGVNNLVVSMVLLFSGLLIPLPLMPGWIERLVAMLPFCGVFDTPFRIYTGHIAGLRIVAAILHQWIWVAILILLSRWLLTRGFRRLVVQGG